MGILLGIGLGEVRSGEPGQLDASERSETRIVITNVAQFQSVPREVFLGRCAFQLTGIVTMVDADRDLLVLQDETGAVAIKTGVGPELGAKPGRRISVTGARCFPAIVGFPNFPYRPTGWEVRPALEGPENWGTYYLTRMRGYLSAPVTGEYTFWIASDNSSELWLSSDTDPAKVKKIAFVSRYAWVAPHEWSHFPSQRSEKIFLQAGQAYYLEAFQEQTSGGDHLAVAWQGPAVNQAVITNRYLRPWIEPGDPVALLPANGIRREYWTNYSLGGLAAVTGPRPFESILSVEGLSVVVQGPAVLPKPRVITFNQALRPEDNYSWVEVQGVVTFTGGDGRGAVLELSNGETQIQVRVLSSVETLHRFRGATVRVTGVCEGVYDQKGVLVPGLVWVVQEDGISLMETAKTNPVASAIGPASKPGLTNSNLAMVGFYNTRGVVTFNDRVLGQDAMFVQEAATALFVSLKDRNFGNQFEVGRWVDLGGSLQPGRNIAVLSPMTMTELGWRFMPEPMTQPLSVPVPGNRDGRWTEVRGVARSVNNNGTVTLMAGSGPLTVWIGKTATNMLNQYVDARLRVRGVLSLTLQDAPILLVPAPSFVAVEQEAPRDPFSVALRSVSSLFAGDYEAALSQRVKLAGNITCNDGRSFYLQDASGGVRVQPVENHEMQIGQAIETVGFPGANGSVRTLTEALVHLTGGVHAVSPEKLDAGEGISFRHAGTLVQISANLIAQRTKGDQQVLELQEKQRVFEAELPLAQTRLPTLVPGSRLQLCGVCDFAAVPPPAAGGVAAESPSTGALKIRLRSPADVVLLSGPPWWTWKQTTALVGVLLTVLIVAMLRIHLLRRRLERQLAISRQMLEGQESERHRIAANLHDGLGQNLLVIKNQARLAMQPVADEAVLRQRLDEISGCASQAIEEVREITHALRPYQLDRLGLTQTIRATVSRAAESSAILFASHADDIDGLFDKESEIHVYRIVQEAVNNILKHSAATEAAVVVKRLPATVSLSIRDNGQGFDVATLHDSNSPDVGHGINGIKERVRILGGTFQMDSRSGPGTSLSIEIPIPKHEAAT